MGCCLDSEEGENVGLLINDNDKSFKRLPNPVAQGSGEEFEVIVEHEQRSSIPQPTQVILTPQKGLFQLRRERDLDMDRSMHSGSGSGIVKHQSLATLLTVKTIPSYANSMGESVPNFPVLSNNFSNLQRLDEIVMRAQQVR
jgi:hypothetical protein